MRPGVTPLLTEAQIQERVLQLAREIAQRMEPDLVIIGLLKGCFVFLADLVRELHRLGVRPRIDFMALSSYGDLCDSSGHVEVRLDCREPIQGKAVLLVDDILDTGHTFTFALAHLRAKEPKELLSCAFLDKPERRRLPMRADFVGFAIPDAFVVGYGLDFANDFRELPYVGVVRTNP